MLARRTTAGQPATPAEERRMPNTWQHVLTDHYTLPAADLAEQRNHHSEHYFLTSPRGPHILSRYADEPGRPPFDTQFLALTALERAGFEPIRLPIPTRHGDHYATLGPDRWVLRRYTPADEAVDWTAEPLVRHAAAVLADLHQAAAAAGPDLLPALDPGDLTPFHWSVEEFLGRLDGVLDGFPWAQLSPDADQALRSTLDWLTAAAADVLAIAAKYDLVGLTHQDFRPANLRVHNEHIVDVLDWDLTRTDHQLYDAAFAALQYGGRECLFPDIDLDLTGAFLDTYLARRNLTELTHEVPKLVPWMLRFTVCKRLLLGWHIPARLDLLARLDRRYPVPRAA
jgi:hypothetical protein